MPVLKNQRWEIFAQTLAEGRSASESYVLAGFRANRGNAGRLRANESVRARTLELQQAAAKSCEISLESVCRELDQAIEVARAKGQAAPLVNAASLRARLGGLLVERHEIGAHGDFSECRTEPEIVASLLTTLAGDEPIEFSDEDRAKAAEIMLGMRDRLVELVASCAAKEISPAPRFDLSQVERKRIADERRKLYGGNGRQR
jgi:hypothetical protein